MTEAELRTLLQQNPDLSVDGGVVSYAMDKDTHRVSVIPKLTEHDLQSQLIAKCNELALTNPAYEMLFAIPNGGYRNAVVGALLKAEGVKAGIPDIFIALPRHSRHGLFIEIKISPNKPSAAQEWWIRRLRVEGYVVEVVYDSVDKAMSLLDWYINC